MGLDATAREANVRDSLKKFFVDTLETIENISLTFDKGLSVPKIQGNSLDKWVSINFKEIETDLVARHSIDIVCCSRKDTEGFILAQLRDKVMGYLEDKDQFDSIRRISLYRSSATEAWTKIGGIMAYPGNESRQMEDEDGTKFKIINVDLRWAIK